MSNHGNFVGSLSNVALAEHRVLGAQLHAAGEVVPRVARAGDAEVAGGDQKYGLGVKELWQVKPEKFQPGLVRHSMGWPLPNTP
jgi:flavin-dependent dehydrogenase